MAKLRRLPGERVEAYIRPTPWSYLPRYLRVLTFAAWGGLLWLLFDHPAWREHEAGSWWQFWTYLWGNAAMAYIFLTLGLAVGGMFFAWALRRTWWIGGALGGALGIAITTLTVGWMGNAYTTAIPVLLGVVSLIGIIVLEIDRFARSITFTNIRLVAHGGLKRAEASVRYTDIADIDTYQPPLGRLLDYGTLIPVFAAHAADEEPIEIQGIRSVAQGKELLAAMVQHATASAQLKKAGQTESRLYRALQHFGRPTEQEPDEI